MNGQVSCQISNFYERENVGFSNIQKTSFEILGCAQFSDLDLGTSFTSRCYHHSDTSIADFSQGDVFVANCQYYYLSGGSTIKCLQCKDGFALKENFCVIDCDTNPKMFMDTPANSLVAHITLNVCDSTLNTHENLTINGVQLSDLDPAQTYSSPFCAYSSRNFADGHVGPSACVKCLDDPDVFPLLDVFALSSASATIVSQDQLSFHPLYRNPLEIACFDIKKKIIQIPQNVKNCALYSKKNDVIGCIKCNLGYKGIAQRITKNLVDYDFFLVECAALTECKSDSLYDGKGLSTHLLGPLNAPLESVISCMECSSSLSNLVFFGTFSQKLILPHPFSSSVPANQILSSGFGDPNLQCLSDSDINTLFSSATLVQNCALYFSNVTVAAKEVPVNASSSSTNKGFHCLACKDGFKATFGDHSSGLRVVTSCSTISNCDSSKSKSFNHCSECASGHAFPLDSNKIDFSECLPYPSASVDSNCLAFDISSSKCMICQNGYTPNIEGLCDILHQPFCETSSRFFQEVQFASLPSINPSFPNIKDFSIFWGLQKTSFRGCSHCPDGFSSLVASNMAPQCVTSNRLYRTQFSPIQNNRVFISNCASIYIDNGIHKCYKCEENFILLSDHSDCILKTDQTKDCSLLLPSDNSKCEACNLPSVKAGSKCLSALPENCLEFSPNNAKEILECSECASGFYLDTVSNSCIKGSFPYCQRYQDNNPSVCTLCMKSHLLMNVSGESKCVYIPHSNCLGLSQSGSFGLSCSSCPPFSRLVSTSISQPTNSQILSFCFPRDSVPHCISHATTSSLSSDSPPCLLCEAHYYLNADSSACLLRTEVVSNCAEYEPKSQLCKSCDSPYFLSQNECISVQSVAQNCKHFLDLQDCQECEEGFYLDKGRCFTAEPINNCLVWRSKDTCAECGSGFALSSDSQACQPISTSECIQTEKFFDNPCLKCANSFHLSTTPDSMPSCVKIQDPNCLELSSISNQTCSQCKENFAVKNGKLCELIKEKILNCSKQSSSKICTKCDPGFYLSALQTECLPLNSLLWHTIDPSCINVQASSEPTCSVCERGYRDPVSKLCSDCKHLAKRFEEREDMIQLGIYLNVFFDDLSMLENYFETTCEICSAKECLICRPEYYMDSSGHCRGYKFSNEQSGNSSSVVEFTNPYNYELEFGGQIIYKVFWLFSISFGCLNFWF